MKAWATDEFRHNAGLIVMTGIAVRRGISTLLSVMNLHRLVDGMKGSSRTKVYMCVIRKERTNKAWIKRNIWKHPPQGWVKINVHVSVRQDTGHATIGGPVRDERGAWIMGFQERFASSSAIWAEFLGRLERILGCQTEGVPTCDC